MVAVNLWIACFPSLTLQISKTIAPTQVLSTRSDAVYHATFD